MRHSFQFKLTQFLTFWYYQHEICSLSIFHRSKFIQDQFMGSGNIQGFVLIQTVFLYRLTWKLPELVAPIYLRYSKRAEWTEHSGTKWTEIFLPIKISREKKYKPERVKLKVVENTKTLVTGTTFLRGGSFHFI